MRILMFIIVFAICLLTAPVYAENNGLISLKSPYAVKETLDRLESIIKEEGITVFARIDHTEEAKQADMELRPTELLIFGNPKVGTPLMQCGQTIAIDFPQKVLAWEDKNGEVWLSYNDPGYLAERHGLTGCDEAIDRVSQASVNLTNAAVSP